MHVSDALNMVTKSQLNKSTTDVDVESHMRQPHSHRNHSSCV